MYQKIGAASAAGVTGGLAYTGLSVVWLALAGFALIGAGAALNRIRPKFARKSIV